MVKIRRMRLVSYIAVLLLITMYVVPSASIAKRGPNAAQMQKRTVLVFPFENADKSSIATFSADLQNSMQAAISSNGVFRAMAFSDKLPSIQRSIRELTLKADDIKGPFGTDKEQVASAIKISREIAADLVLVGSIDDIQVKAEANKAEVILTAVLADVNTGETVKTVAITGQTPANTKSTVEAELVSLATGDAVTKLVKELAPTGQAIAAAQPTKDTTSAPVVVKQQSKKKNNAFKKFIVPIVIGVAIALVASGGSDDDNGSLDIPPGGSPF